MKFHLSLLDVLNSKTKVKIIKFLLTHEASMSEREIASILKVSHMSVNRTIRELADINFVDYVVIGKAHLWKINCKSYAFRALSKLIKGILTIKEPLEELAATILKNLPKSFVKRIILFGSIAKGLEKVSSDIDVFILVKDKHARKRLEPKTAKLSKICLDRYGNRLAPYILTEQQFKRKKNLKVISEIHKGIQIFPRRKDRHGFQV